MSKPTIKTEELAVVLWKGQLQLRWRRSHFISISLVAFGIDRESVPIPVLVFRGRRQIWTQELIRAEYIGGGQIDSPLLVCDNLRTTRLRTYGGLEAKNFEHGDRIVLVGCPLALTPDSVRLYARR